MQNKIMGIESDLVDVLNDLVNFLESLSEEVNLPEALENDRSNLLRRSKCSLVAMGQRSASPEPYLDMNAGKGKGLLLVKSKSANSNDTHLTEYIDSDNPCTPKISQDEYECFQEELTHTTEQNIEEEKLKATYRNFSAEQTKIMCECKCLKKCVGKCHLNMNKCGILFQKEERKLFGFQLFDQLRECWIGLVGRHLLIYNTKHDKHPAEVISIRGYSARPVTDVISRDLDRNKPAFEIFCLGDKTYQFIAKHPKEAEQWIAIINKVGSIDSVRKSTNGLIKEITSIHEKNTSFTAEERYQDIGDADHEKILNIKEIENNKKNNEDGIQLRSKHILSSSDKKKILEAPPLPARIPFLAQTPRRLPSLPQNHEPAFSFNTMDDGYDKDGIYYDIEDLKQPSGTYENLKKHEQAMKNGKQVEVETYDDVAEAKKKKDDKSKKKKDFSKRNSHTDTYDDIHIVDNNISLQESTHEEPKSITYDDKEVVVDNVKKESPRKKSFLGRMRNKKDSTKKEKNKKNSAKEIIPIQSEISQELPTYDDVSELSSAKNNNLIMGTMPEYTCPPPPRPLYVKPPTIDNFKSKENIEELYDDIEALRNDLDLKTHNISVGSCIVESPSLNNEFTRAKNSSTVMNESSFKPKELENDVEHYQVPRPQDPIDSGGQLGVAPTEELYDDVAILVDFRARRRDSACSNSSSEKTLSNVSKAWNRFASGRK
ncbi:uncharacterized protein [Chelonus insularis]|uniref:uncharacterized protein n=1 Tax=Chelonus insularis TaxID=460826 RepID=UPI00158D0F01|nr:uncharacterized protein LOC118075032 [Chelonus insularis]